MYSRNDISDSLNVFVGYRHSIDSSSRILCQAQNHQNHVANKSHYTKNPVNPNFRYIDNILVLNESPTNESLYRLTKVIELTKVHLDFRKSYSTIFRLCHQLSSSWTPAVEIRNPAQWKYESPPQWKLGFDSGDESVYPYSGN